jgi:DNA-binding CsgD family transcriptional regulator
MTGEEIPRPRDLVRTAFYERLLKRYDLFHRLCGVLHRNDDVIYYVAVHRGKSQPSFEEEDKRLLASLLSHLSVAFENHWTLLRQRSLCTALSSVIDQFGPAVFVVDSEGRILLSNRTSALFGQPSTGLFIKDFHIAAERRADHLALLKTIRTVSGNVSGVEDKIDPVLAITSTRYPYPVMVTVRPLGALFNDQTGTTQHAVIVIAKDPSKAHNVESCPFARIYDLTPAQARVTEMILLGRSLGGTAKALNVSENTVRSHLKQIYWKTNTHGQMDLVLLHAQVCSEHL